MEPQNQSIGNYQILSTLGRGGMGTVYRALDTRIGREVALKVVTPGDVNGPEDQREASDRFRREARSAGILSHPNLVTVHEFGETDRLLYIVMELVGGPGLDHLMKQQGRLEPRFVADVIRQAAGALDYAHRKGIVHRDIKPGNIMLGEGGLVKVADFGIAKMLMEPNVTRTGFAVGTPFYMSPEQVRGESLDGRADQYSLAVVAYELLSGAKPFSGDSLPATLHNVLFTSPAPVHTLNPSVPERATEVLSRAMSKDRAGRYNTCAEFAADFDAALGHAPLAPPAASPAAPARRSAWKLLLAAMVVVPMIAAGIALYLREAPKQAPNQAPHQVPAAALTLPAGDMVLVEAGDALLGRERQPVRVEAFYLDKTEVTNRAWAEFCRESGRAAQLAAPELPAVNVSVEDAQAFARWAGKRLPTAVEWEKAARGARGWNFPWGDEFRPGLANLPQSPAEARSAALAAADSHAPGQSPCGALNLVGNVWEWVNTPATPPQGAEFTVYSQMFRDLAPPLSPTEPFFQARGGSYRFYLPAGEAAALAYDASPVPARARKPDIGFRCAKDVPR